MHSSEVRWAPHLVGVELVWASVLVAVLRGVNAINQGVASLKAELFIPTIDTILLPSHDGVLESSGVCVSSHIY